MLRRAMKAKQTGFTLIELMVTIFVLAILLGIGVPNFRDFIRNSRITGATNDIITDFNLARSEAVKRRVPVTLCKSSAEGDACDTNAGTPFTRWIVFVDNSGNAVVDGSDEVLRRREIHPTIRVRTNTNGRLKVYQSSGFPNNAIAGDVILFVLCDERKNVTTVGGDSAARAVTIETTGRASATRNKETITDLGGCPL
jgi:type IV fimbrial biogenesis protein FimT